ncbi:hypothetical protein CFC21_002283, partial [Triticum aestivum]
APGVPRRADAGVGQVGVGDPRATQEVAHLARHLPHRRDGRARARRRRARHQGRPVRAPQLPGARRRPPARRLAGAQGRAGRRRIGRR